MSIKTQKLIVVIGMHRTGTSLITRGLQVMGVSLGQNLLPAMANVNAKGFWEDADINAFNIEMLHSLQSEWDCLKPLTQKDVQALQHQGFFLKAVELLRLKVMTSYVFGLKDPRIAKLLPFWDQVFAHCGYDVNYLLTIRNPLSVVKSLQLRDNMATEKAYLLWFTHVVSALVVPNKNKISLVDYDCFMQNPTTELTRLANDFGLQINAQELANYLETFIDASLRHSQFELNDLQLDQSCPSIVIDIYTQLLMAARRQTAFANDGAMAKKINDWGQLLAFGEIPFSMIDILYQDTAKACEKILSYEQDIQQKNNFILSLEKFNAERTQQVDELYAETLVRDAHINDMNVEIIATGKALTDTQQSLTDTQQSLTDTQQSLTDTQQSLTDTQQSLTDTQQSLMNTERVLEITEQALVNTEQLLVSTEQQALLQAEQLISEINRVFTATLERDQHINILDDTILSLEAQLQQLTSNVQLLTAENSSLISSRSWRLTRPLRLLGRVVTHGFSRDDKHQLYLRLQRLQHKMPFFIQALNRKLYRQLLQPILGTGLTSASTVRITHDAVVNDTDTPAVQTSAPSIIPANTSGTDFIIWGVIDWHFRHQRPQQIAQALASEGDRVFYISSNLVESKTPSFTLEALNNSGRLFQINLSVEKPVAIYNHAPAADVLSNVLASTGQLLLWANTGKIVNIVQHPFWHPVAQAIPNSTLVYDCMDHHEGFGNTGKEIIALEHQLFRGADLTITTSAWLDDIVSTHTSRRELIRNAGDYEHFSVPPTTIYRDAQSRKIIGYIGAIAEWFDVELVSKLATQFNDCCILLVGADTVNAKAQLKAHDNICFIGEVAYKNLPHYLYSFDVCLLPFKVIPLTLATNPVKVYEYLGAGKAVVTVDLPEIKQFGELVMAASDHAEFLAHVAKILASEKSKTLIAARQTFAQQQTWHHRAKDMSRAVQSLKPKTKVSVIVVTYNNLELTKICLSSLYDYTHHDNLEVIVVDNASSDSSPEYLREWAQQTGHPGESRLLILNADNKGFAAANNQGLLIATGDYLVLLNNDTHVTPGWVNTLVKHIERDPSIGLIGPVTNNIGNEAKINIQYNTMSDMLIESSHFTLRHIGHLTPMRTAAFFCVMMSRATYEKVGLLDEVFGIGFFEDDDYCRRIEQVGLRVVCADDVFIHHNLSASFNKLKHEVRQKLFEQNKVTYEAKWGAWIPHVYRSGI